MSQNRRSVSALAALLPAGALGLSVSLASADAEASIAPKVDTGKSVAQRLQSIRDSVSGALSEIPKDGKFLKTDPEKRMAWWGNGGWHNWNNWSNAPVIPFITPWNNWNNGWHNWGNGWHNGWHNW
ncbi:MAG TPA: GrrA/OscA1 family cyclophane-containing rSAM-modified RiPP [Reyranella sp.]|nr:GrrA/OscA1 family cyclophane-containing rSAM-modified RiPP [Reyranella sp.]